MSIYLFIYLSIYLSVCLSVYLFQRVQDGCFCKDHLCGSPHKKNPIFLESFFGATAHLVAIMESGRKNRSVFGFPKSIMELSLDPPLGIIYVVSALINQFYLNNSTLSAYILLISTACAAKKNLSGVRGRGVIAAIYQGRALVLRFAGRQMMTSGT